MLKLRYSKALGHILLIVLKQLLELFMRVLFLCLPLGFYIFILQNTNKPRTTTSITNEFLDVSTWMRVAPGTLMVCRNGYEHKMFYKAVKKHLSKNFNIYFTVLRFVTYAILLVTLLVYLVKEMI